MMMFPRRTASTRGPPIRLLLGILLMVSPVLATAADAGDLAMDGVGSSTWDTLLDDVAAGWSELTAFVGAVHIPLLPAGPIIVQTRIACNPATRDGTFDCGAAITKVCKRNGFAFGSNLDIETGEVCRGDQLIARRHSADARCKPKTWTTRVMCW